ncbi:hypothetical protein CRH09_15345 [Nocardia terpenica]|uniref:Uncharacterized protein n=1 Tax=Nocardia terpenica TaxID=455432 RepID=A0A291RJ08_9NOCA|nr:hypothetical protein CRH09_15345 [Nocardia terpenica]
MIIGAEDRCCVYAQGSLGRERNVVVFETAVAGAAPNKRMEAAGDGGAGGDCYPIEVGEVTLVYAVDDHGCGVVVAQGFHHHPMIG